MPCDWFPSPIPLFTYRFSKTACLLLLVNTSCDLGSHYFNSLKHAHFRYDFCVVSGRNVVQADDGRRKAVNNMTDLYQICAGHPEVQAGLKEREDGYWNAELDKYVDAPEKGAKNQLLFL